MQNINTSFWGVHLSSCSGLPWDAPKIPANWKKEVSQEKYVACLLTEEQFGQKLDQLITI